LLATQRALTIRHAPVVNCAAMALKSAEMWVQLHRLNGTEPSRGPSFRLPTDQSRQDFQDLFSRGSKASSRPDGQAPDHQND
jgi:hypothetical protein